VRGRFRDCREDRLNPTFRRSAGCEFNSEHNDSSRFRGRREERLYPLLGWSARLVLDSREPPQFGAFGPTSSVDSVFMVVTTAQHTAQHTRGGPAHGRMRRQKPPVGSGPHGRGPASARDCARGWRPRSLARPQRRPTRLGRTPIEGATPELEPVDREAIRVVGTLSSWIYDRVSFQD
jgi:hypothetical protein